MSAGSQPRSIASWSVTSPAGSVASRPARRSTPRPASRARTIACARSATWSLLKMFETWLRTVLPLMCRRPAIVGLARPCAISASTSRSRSVRPGNTSEGISGRGAERYSISRLAIGGPKIASPLPTATIARRISSWSSPLRRYPRAPRAASPRTTESSSPYSVRTSTPTWGLMATISAGRLHPVDVRQVEIHDDHLRLEGERLVDRVAAGRRLTDHLGAVHRVE